MKEIRDAGRKTGRCVPAESAQDLPVSSRRTALETLRIAVSFQPAGPLLLTGEPGTGKTWLWKRLAHELQGRWGCLAVEMSEALDPLDFLRLIGEGLGIDVGERIGIARTAVARALEDDLSDGRSWMLVLENAQNASQPVWNEVHALVHAMEASRGFGAVILTGPSVLARRLAARPMTALASRIATHVHLLPFDFDEACELIESRDGSAPMDRAVLDELHRESSGNPRRLLQVLRKRPWQVAVPAIAGSADARPRLTEPIAVQDVVAPVRAIAPAGDSASFAAQAPREVLASIESRGREDALGPPAEVPLVPSRPPLRVEEGLVEVGWEGSLEDESALPAEEGPGFTTVDPPVTEGDLPSEEMVEDHYAALQAWTEWARNRGRGASPGMGEDQPSSELAASMAPETSPGDAPPIGDVPRSAGLRVESQHEHAPYSQLFSRLRQSR